MHITSNIPTEDTEQIMLMRWAEYSSGKYPQLKLLLHIPNGGKRSKAEAGRFKAMGVKPGVPDLFLPVPLYGFHGVFIEMKRSKGGTVSEAQQEWMDALRKQGYAVEVCHGWEPAKEILLQYLTGRYKAPQKGATA